MKYDIFISYRREGGYETAKHLNDLLVRDGYTVSFDVDTLRNGDFDRQLYSRIDECTDFIIIINEHAFDRTLDPIFSPEKDWMRCELAYALKTGKNIIPVMLAGAMMPDNLPDDIKDVTMKNGPVFNHFFFDSFYKELKERFILSSNRKKNKYLYVLLPMIVLGIISAVYLTIIDNIGKEADMNNSSINVVDSAKQGNEPAIDSTKYYFEQFDDTDYFVKGLKHAIQFKKGEGFGPYKYEYRCGEIIEISSYFEKQDFEFVYYDLEGAQTSLTGEIDFKKIGYEDIEELSWFPDSAEFLIGQCDLNEDEVDELIIAMRAGNDIWVDRGIGLNIFKLDGKGFRKVAVVAELTTASDMIARIKKNHIYIPYHRGEGSFIMKGDTVYRDNDGFDGSAKKGEICK